MAISGSWSDAPKRVLMAPKLAYRNLFHDLASLVVTLTGIVFSVVLIAIQCGIYIGSERMIAAMQDHSHGDLWLVPLGTASFDDPSLLDGRERFVALSTPGVAGVEELVVGFGDWRKPLGGYTAVLVIGSDIEAATLLPWDVVDGSVGGIAGPAAIAVDKTYLSDLGIAGVGDTAEINGARVSVAAVSDGIRSFTTLPYAFTTLARARMMLQAGGKEATFVLVQLEPGADVEKVRTELAARLPDVEVLTHDEFRKRGVDYWLFETGAGSALIAGVILGLIVGVVIVAQALYASTKDHLPEFATLRALGASARYIHVVILIQAVLSALIGYGAGMALSFLAIWATTGSSLVIVMTPSLAILLFALTLGMCVMAALAAIVKVTMIDPAEVFSR